MCLNFSKRRNDVFTGLKIMKLTLDLEKLKKVFPFEKIDFDLLCKFSTCQIDKN